MSLVTIEQLTKSYGEKVLFADISFTLEERQRIGLIGVNGTGKSSLLKAIAGVEPADSGKITHAKDFRVEYLVQDPEFDEGVTVLDHLFRGNSPLIRTMREYEEALLELELDPANEKKQAKLFAAQQKMDTQHAWEAEALAKAILNKLGVGEYKKEVAHLSGGQRKRVALAAALIQPADLLILDEPTNHIDNQTVEWLEGELSRYRGALLLVTHDRYFLDRVTNRILELDHGKLYSYDGNYSVFLDKKAEREEQEASSEAKRQNLLRRELEWLKRGAKARTTKQKARIQRVEELRDRKTAGPEEGIDFSVAASRLGRKVLELDHAGITLGGRKLFEGFNHIFLPGERIGIVGPNGSGKSTLLNMLAGRVIPESGAVDTGQTVKLAFYTQENEELEGSKRVIEYIKDAAEIIHTADGEAITAGQMLERFLFPGPLQWTFISRLSGGEKRRLYLLKTLMGEPNVLLLDEPTNDLDIQTLTVLEDYLDGFPGTVVSVSHDRYFLDRTVDRLFIFDGNGHIRKFEGNYTEYMDALKAEEAAAEKDSLSVNSPRNNVGSSAAGANDTPATNRGKEPVRKLSYKEQKEWEQIEGVIAALEEKSAHLKQQLAEHAADYDKVRDLYEEEQRVDAELEQAMDRWAELSALVEEIAGKKSTF
ncbi:ABC-F family ATP-binding cassette domain-containing protein [Gorillibacterium massiliense]|uniref:ABC-F family ATP-binding cassette domain-containing protein n=1 Tax=Gorillibacterium massiliense TaxID=1280390 RepID=UPI0004BC65F0|nr:ABC-F family ATP-binding cassette domain-containing protein [Gorillibacterium massiliense]